VLKTQFFFTRTKAFIWWFSPGIRTVNWAEFKFRSLLWFSLVIVFGVAFGKGPPTPTQETSVITNLAQIHALSREESQKAYPVRVQGVVTWQQQNRDAFVIDDGTQAVYVDTAAAKKMGVWAGGDLPKTANEPGALVEVEGITDPGGYAPIIVCVNFKRTGSGTQAPRHLAMDQLISGSADALWVEVEGVVESLTENQGKFNGIRLLVAGQICRVRFEDNRGLDATALLDAKVRVRGVLTSVYNLRSEVVGLKLSANGVQDIDVLSPPPSNPFLAPKVKLNELRLFSPNSEVAFHRKVTYGIVTFAIPHKFFFIQNGLRGVRVESSSAVVQVGERVEVAGFVSQSQSIASIKEAIVCSLGTIDVSPISVTAEQILHPPMSGFGNEIAKEDLNCRLVKIRGTLIQCDQGNTAGIQELLVGTGGHVIKVYLPLTSPTNAPATANWQKGTELELSGVCELDLKEDEILSSTISITDFHLWLRSQKDVQIVKNPPWWTVKRLWTALVVTSLLILSGIGWSLSLHWLLRKRTNRFEEVMSVHRNVELEYTSARRERLRLAADLHDGLKQLIAAASFRLEAAEGNLPDSPIVAGKHLASARATLTRTQEELQDCMQGLHALEEGPPQLEALLRQVVASTDYWPKEAVVIESKGTSRDLPRDVAGSLLLLFQEAVSNAFHHGQASQINALVDYAEDSLYLRIVDNGTGFEPATAAGVGSGHFGLDGMKQRIKWLQGDFAVTRHAGGGMEVLVRIYWSAIKQAEAMNKTRADEPKREL